MSRFLTISHVEGGPTLVYGPLPAKIDGHQPPAPLIADFRDGMDAMRFLSAIANAQNNPTARADYVERRALYARIQGHFIGETQVDRRWYVYEQDGEHLIVATFTTEDDADLFVKWMRLGA